MRIFVDVGAHYGETLNVALDPRWGFERLYSFEPAEACLRRLRGFRDRRITVVPAGLSNRDGTATLFGAGLLGASVYADKKQRESRIDLESVRLLRATDWLAENTSAGDTIYMKLNCEGSECDVLDDLLDSRMISRIGWLYVDFDVRKIPSQAYRQRSVESRLRERGVRFTTPDALGRTGDDAVRTWLEATCPPGARTGRLRYRLRLHQPPYVRATALVRAVLPRAVFVGAGRHLGTQARRRLVAGLSGRRDRGDRSGTATR